jgi:hypothetical protein
MEIVMKKWKLMGALLIVWYMLFAVWPNNDSFLEGILTTKNHKTEESGMLHHVSL